MYITVLKLFSIYAKFFKVFVIAAVTIYRQTTFHVIKQYHQHQHTPAHTHTHTHTHTHIHTLMRLVHIEFYNRSVIVAVCSNPASVKI